MALPGPSWQQLSPSRHLLPGILRALFHEGGSGDVGAGIFPPQEPLMGTLLPQPLLLSHSMHYVNCLCC